MPRLSSTALFQQSRNIISADMQTKVILELRQHREHFPCQASLCLPALGKEIGKSSAERRGGGVLTTPHPHPYTHIRKCRKENENV